MPAHTLPATDFELLFAALPEPLGALAPDGTVLAVNTALTALLGPAAPDLSGQPLAALCAALAAAGHALAPAEAWASGLQAAQAGSAQTLPPQLPSTLPAPPRWTGTLQPVPAVGELRYVLLRFQRASELPAMQRILDQLPLTISTMEGDDLTFTFLSKQAQKSMGPRAQVGRSVAACLPEVAAQGYLQMLQEVRDSGQPRFGHEERAELLDPATGGVQVRYSDFGYLPLHGLRGAGVLAYGLDVTEQVLARQRGEALTTEARTADQRLRRVTESLPSITFISNQKGEVLYISPQWFAYTGANPATDDLARDWQASLHPDDDARVRQEYEAALAAGMPWRYELRLRRHDGEYRWFMSQGVPEPLEEAQAAGRSRQWFGSDLDIHELHEAQRQLELKDQQLSLILDRAPAVIARLDGPEHRYTFINSAYAAITGGRAQVGKTAAECLPEVVNQGFIALLDKVYQTGEAYTGQAVPVRLLEHAGASDEGIIYVDHTYLALRDDHGAITGVLSFALDVTERVRTQQRAERLAAEMGRRDEQVRAITASVPVFIFNFDPQGSITYINPYFYEYTGLNPAAPPDEAWDTLPEDDRAEVGSSARAAMALGQPWQAQFRVRRRDGELRWFQTKAQPYADAAGQLAGFSAATVEIHELHTRSEELVRSRADFAALADNIAQLAWMGDATGYLFWYNQQWYDYTGSTFEEMQGAGWMSVHDPALVAGVNERFLASIRAGEPWEDTFPLRRHDGEYRWFLSRARPIRDAATGAVARWFGTNTDVTELRQLQQRLSDGEEELRIQAESIPQQVWTAQPDGTVDFYNHRTAAYLGVAMEKNGAAHWLSFVHPDDRAPMQARWNQAIASQRYYEAEFRLRRYDGQYRWFLGQAQARRAPGGQVMKWYGTNTDVHQQRQLQEQVLASQARFQQLLETLPQMAWTSRPDGSVSYYNQRWYDFTGGTFQELQDWGWERFVHPDDLPNTLRRWQHSIDTGQPFEAEHRWRDQQGAYRWFLARAEAIRDQAGDVALWVGANTDVHEFKQVQQQLEEQNARLLRTNEDLDNFVYTASHDLKQPINNMAGIFEELTRTAYFRDPDAIKLISYFERALAQIFSTIDDLSAIVRGQRQQQEIPAETVDLATLVTEVVNSLQDQVTQTGAAFELDFATCPAIFFVRPNLQSLLFNLISNSLKYASPNRPAVIRLSCTPDAATGRPILTVQDNGMGIDMERFGSQLFQLFRRFHTHVDGTGMGLYLVNRIVQIHGGHLDVSSVVDEGTTFTIYL
ncbi:MAG TPA: PAS domain-containing protein [Hymenobacter sp.]|jgi:PAS domain S-box-containing protein|uniref:PAS domain-containing protein n=1 Tax=Hymenobacter sp. TaxID=1898978 RepID=UPI002ED9171C